MSTETERRFLVRVIPWAAAAEDAAREHLVQVYLVSARERTVRVRLHEERAVLTIKGPTVAGSRTEIESDIAVTAARAILDSGLYAGVPVEKTRSTLTLGSLTWEVDQFEGANAGLIMAEVELDDAVHERTEWDARVSSEQPVWLGREITGEPRFSNSSLAIRPFSTWPEEEREEVMREIEAAAGAQR